MVNRKIVNEQKLRFRTQLAGQISKGRIDDLVDYVLHHTDTLEILFSLIDDPESKVNWRAAWACKHVGLQHPELLLPYRKRMVEKACKYAQPGIRRELLSLLYRLPVDEPFPVELFDLSLECMLSPDVPVGIQALCIKLAYKLGLSQPELLPELALYLEHADPANYQPGTVTTVRKTRVLIQKKLKSR